MQQQKAGALLLVLVLFALRYVPIIFALRVGDVGELFRIVDEPVTNVANMEEGNTHRDKTTMGGGGSGSGTGGEVASGWKQAYTMEREGGCGGSGKHHKTPRTNSSVAVAPSRN